jgi:hypothetical protein
LTFYLIAVAFTLSVLGATIALLESSGTREWVHAFALVPAVTAGIVALGGLGCLPGVLLWLFTISRYPTRWRAARRRFLAVITTPVIGAFWAYWFVALQPTGTAILRSLLYFGLLPLGAGFVVTLPEVRRGEALALDAPDNSPTGAWHEGAN